MSHRHVCFVVLCIMLLGAFSRIQLVRARLKIAAACIEVIGIVFIFAPCILLSRAMVILVLLLLVLVLVLVLILFVLFLLSSQAGARCGHCRQRGRRRDTAGQ